MLINLGNDCQHAVKHILSSLLLSTNAKRKEYTEIRLYSSLWARNASLTLKEERKIRVLENAVRGEIFWLKWEEVTDEKREVLM